jgi:hypothetical protein
VFVKHLAEVVGVRVWRGPGDLLSYVTFTSSLLLSRLGLVKYCIFAAFSRLVFSLPAPLTGSWRSRCHSERPRPIGGESILATSS